MKQSDFLKIFFLALFSIAPFLVSAQEPFSYVDNFFNQLGGVLAMLIPLIVASIFVVFLWGMMVFILNSGNEEKRSEGKRLMFWGIIILVVVVSFWGIIEIMQIVFGTDLGHENPGGVKPEFPQTPNL